MTSAATGLDREEADLQAGITQAKALYDDTVAAGAGSSATSAQTESVLTRTVQP